MQHVKTGSVKLLLAVEMLSLPKDLGVNPATGGPLPSLIVSNKESSAECHLPHKHACMHVTLASAEEA